MLRWPNRHRLSPLSALLALSLALGPAACGDDDDGGGGGGGPGPDAGAGEDSGGGGEDTGGGDEDTGGGGGAVDPATATEGTVRTSTYVLPVGQRVELTGDLHLVVAGPAQISGTLVAPAGSGFGLRVEAEGDVTVSGEVAAGSGAAGVAGGELALVSLQGDLLIEAGATVAGGDGGGGADLALTEQGSRLPSGTGAETGAAGGSLVLQAPNGTLTVPAGAGVLHVGDGGDGVAVEVRGTDLDTLTLDTLPDTTGGASGRLHIDAQQIEGLSYETVVYEQDVVDPTSGEVLIPTGATVHFMAETDQISGGEAGDAGGVWVGVTAEGDPTWPGGEQQKSSRLAPWPLPWPGPPARPEEPEVDVERHGHPGAPGYRRGGAGQSVGVGGRGDINTDGASGQSVQAWGGRGGPCPWIDGREAATWATVSCVPGAGGAAIAVGGFGTLGTCPEQGPFERSGGPGGDGGSAAAHGGMGGMGARPAAGGGLVGVFGEGGPATAVGGSGGSGGCTCSPTNSPTSGGPGGAGGSATASGGNAALMEGDQVPAHVLSVGTGRASGGAGGDGGAGLAPGAGGAGGEASASGAPPLRQEPGADGALGERCPGDTPMSCPCEEATLELISGEEHCTAADMCNSYWCEVYNGRLPPEERPPGGYTPEDCARWAAESEDPYAFANGEVISVWGCEVRFNCNPE